MSHTWTYNIDGKSWTVTGNPDLSGDLTLKLSSAKGIEVRIPGELILSIVAEYARRELIADIESQDPIEVLLGMYTVRALKGGETGGKTKD